MAGAFFFARLALAAPAQHDTLAAPTTEPEPAMIDLAAAFVAPDVIQLRLVLGEIDHPAQTSAIPAGLDVGPDETWVRRGGEWLGRLGGKDRDVWMPVAGFEPGAAADQFALSAEGRAPVDAAGAWTVFVNGAPVAVDAVSRKATILDSGQTGNFVFDFQTLQNVFLTLEAPLSVGDTVEVRFTDPDIPPVSVTYDPGQVVSEAIHVNLVGFDPDDAVKTGYLSSWNGVDAATGTIIRQAYEAGTAYSVVDEVTGQTVATGTLSEATPQSQTTNFTLNFADTDVWELDFSGVQAAGTYHLVVDGVGRSQSFVIDDLVYTDLFDTAFSGFYHQRSGIALDAEFTDWTRPRSLHPDDGFVVQQSTIRLMDTGEGYDGSLAPPFDQFAGNTTGEVLTDAWGGWHDAGDFDRRAQHLEASRKLIELVELAPDFAERAHASIPEAGDAIPDLLDEAMWNLDFFRRLQKADGGVPGGIESDDHPQYGEGSWADSLGLYAYAPDVWSTWEYAASAAKLARALGAYDPSAVAGWTESALRAMAWAEARVPAGAAFDATLRTSQNLAAAELYALTGEARWADLYAATTVYDGRTGVQWFEQQWEAGFLYARTEGGDAGLQGYAQAALTNHADFLLAQGLNGPFGYTVDPYAPYGWGNTAQHPNYAADFHIRAHALTGDARYLNQAQSDVQYALGANPLNQSFLTGLGVREPLTALNLDAEAMGAAPPPGLLLFGDYNVADYGEDTFFHDIMRGATLPTDFADIPVHESYGGFFLFVPSTEYTVQQGISDMTFVTGYLAAQQDEVTRGQTYLGTDEADDYRGGRGDDVLTGEGGADRLIGGEGDDVILGGAGADVIYGDGL